MPVGSSERPESVPADPPSPPRADPADALANPQQRQRSVEIAGQELRQEPVCGIGNHVSRRERVLRPVLSGELRRKT